MKIFLFLFLFMVSLYSAPKAVIFDFGGVIATSVSSTIKSHLKTVFDLNDEEISQLRSQQKAFMKEGASEEAFWLNLAEIKKIDLPNNWIDEWHTTITNAIVVNPEMLTLITELKARNLCVGLLSNIDYNYAVLLRKLGYYHAFDPCILSCDVSTRKPDNRIYQLLLDKLGLLPEDVIFIDDKEANIAAAKKLGFDTILFENDEVTKALLTQKKAL